MTGTQRQNPHLLWPVLLLLAVLPEPAWSQPTVELRAVSRQAFVGEAFQITIVVGDFETCDPPVMPDIPNCAIQSLGVGNTSSQTMIIGDRVSHSKSNTYRYELTPTRVGELTIPAITVAADGRKLSTRPLKIKVRLSDRDELFAVEITAGRQRVYVGQRISLTMTIWVKPARYGNQRLDPAYILRRISPINFGPFPQEISNSHNVSRARIIDDKRVMFYAYDFVTEFVPQHPGPLAFDDIVVGIAYPSSKGERNLRARPIVDAIEVLPVPMDGRPANFNGAVGLYDIETRAAPTGVRVGDPIELTIELFGDGALDTLPPPLLSANAELERDFRLPDARLAGEIRGGRKRFSVMIRAQRDDITAIPAIEYPYFDPDAERFVVARSGPIPITVAPAAEVAAPDIAGGPNGRAARSGSALEALDGLHDIETREEALLAGTRPVNRTLVILLLLVPPPAFLLVWGLTAYVQSRAGDPTGRRRRGALRAARAGLTEARGRPARECAAEINAALATYLADRLDRPPASFTGAATLDQLSAHNVPADVIEQWKSVVQRCEEASFGGASEADVAALVTQARVCIKQMERHRL